MLPATVLQLDLDKAKEQRQASSTILVTAETSNHETHNLFIDDVLSLVLCTAVLQVIAHTHYIDTHANTAMAKKVVPMSLHRYNWDLPRQANGNQPYFACQGFGTDCAGLKVLAFSPSGEAAGQQRQLARVCLSPARAGCFGDGPWQGSCMAKPAL